MAPSRRDPRSVRAVRRIIAVALVLAAPLAGCAREEIVPETYLPSSAWDEYRRSLQDAGLAGTALGGDWRRVADAAIAVPVDIDLPYVERGTFDSREAHAFGYRFPVARGQRVQIELRLDGPVPEVFLDVYREREEEAPLHIASADAASRQLIFEPRADADYLLRLQPELLRGGDFELTVQVDAALTFPVADHGMPDVWSEFGAPRDGGRRSHHGVDIFAARGTAAVAVTRAYVRRVREQNLGGLTVWLHDRKRNLHLYYAHLDEQLVEPGQWVNAGDIVGRVGNTGNARTTPPHLHFAIYSNGPINPDVFLRPTRGTPRAPRADLTMLGEFAATDASTTLRAGLGRSAPNLADLMRGTPLRVWAAAGDSYRVSLPDGSVGFVAANSVGLASDSANND